MSAHNDCDVIILGGGPVGLFLACELGAYGVRCEVFEQNQRLSVHPKANTHSARSMELYRRHGLSEPFRNAGWPANRPADIGYFTRLTTYELGRVAMPSPAQAIEAAKTDNARWPTPEPQLRASQLVLEPMLKARAEQFPNVTLSYGAEVTGLVDHGTHVSVTVGQRTRTARFVVGCDGARSFTRSQIGITYEGEGGLDLDFMGGTMLTTYFRAPTLLDVISAAPAWQYWIVNPQRRNLVVSLDGGAHFVLHAQVPDIERFDFTQALTEVVGVAVPHEVISSAPWRGGRALVATHYGKGNVALAGDAAHLFTPTGGLGANTGIEDAANLAWKLAGAVAGWGGDGLLNSYERERKPIAERNTKFALSLARAVSACPTHPEMETDSELGMRARDAARAHIDAVARNEFDHPGLQLGTRYDNGGLIVGADTEDRPVDVAYAPSMKAGGRLPHAWLSPGKSTLDLCGHRFTLIDFTGQPATDFEGRVPFVGHAIDRPDLVERFGVERVLVRPDQIICWSGPSAPLPASEVDAIFETVTGHRSAGIGTFDQQG